ncbi:Hypothetical predicted protein [Marmota monax]|uniref:Uncharacterized protein n=1 Tax=Marmota monax TaxID=9995 RepID=A0A5E4ANG9_MARMO|nr:Hypothetical predicted protein [Marmota monax]
MAQCGPHPQQLRRDLAPRGLWVSSGQRAKEGEMPAGVDSKVAESGRASGAGTPRQTEAGPEAAGLPSHPVLAIREQAVGEGTLLPSQAPPYTKPQRPRLKTGPEKSSSPVPIRWWPHISDKDE